MKVGFVVIFLVALHSALGEDIDSIEMRYFTVVSDTKTHAFCPGYSGNARTYHLNAWTASIPGAYWIWGAHNNGRVMYCRFQRNFYVFHGLRNAILDVAADNNFSTFINRKYAYCSCGTSYCFLKSHQKRCYVKNYMHHGTNRLEFGVLNQGGPAGLLYRLHLFF